MLHRQTDLFHSQHSIHWPLVRTDSTSQLVTSPVIHQSIGPTTMSLILLLVKHHTQHCSGWATFAKHTSLGCEPSTCIGKNQLLRLIVNISQLLRCCYFIKCILDSSKKGQGSYIYLYTDIHKCMCMYTAAY